MAVVCGVASWRDATALCTPSFTAWIHCSASTRTGIMHYTRLLLWANNVVQACQASRVDPTAAAAILVPRFHVVRCDSLNRNTLLLDAEGRGLGSLVIAAGYECGGVECRRNGSSGREVPRLGNAIRRDRGKVGCCTGRRGRTSEVYQRTESHSHSRRSSRHHAPDSHAGPCLRHIAL